MTWDTKNSEQIPLPIKPPNILPIAGDFSIISQFGKLKSAPFFPGVRPKFYTGTDFKTAMGTPVLATSNGKVVRVQCIRTGYGNNIVIKHDSIYKSLYAHLSQIHVEVGQTVMQGEIIGEVGNSGGSIEPHLHYEVIENGKKVNPENFFLSAKNR
jgi:murein DD-endopeptidase MepM/ murein hydrolase activator NlpD